MNEEKTSRLIQALRESSNFKQYVTKYEDQFTDMTFPEYLLLLCQKYHLKKGDVIRDSGISKSYGYQIFTGQKHPSRDKTVMLSYGLLLNFEGTNRLLNHAKYNPLYPKNRRDSILMFAKSNDYDLVETNELLDSEGLEILN